MVDPPVHIPKEPDPEKHLRWGLWILAVLGALQVSVTTPAVLALGSPWPLEFDPVLTGVGLLGALWVALGLLRWVGVARRFVVVAAAVSAMGTLVALPAVSMQSLAHDPAANLDSALRGVAFGTPYLIGCALVASGVGKLLDVPYEHPAERALARGLLWTLGVGSVAAVGLGLSLRSVGLWVLPTALVGYACLRMGWVASHVLLWWAAFPGWFVVFASMRRTSDTTIEVYDYHPPLVLAVLLVFLAVVVGSAALLDVYCLLSPDEAERIDVRFGEDATPD